MAEAAVTATPFDLLLDIERKSQRHAAGLPAQTGEKQDWTGILFRLKGTELLAPMEQVAEIVSMPDVARVPGVKPWVLGIANMRGNLLPVADLQGYLYGENVPSSEWKQGSLLVLRQGDMYAGLLVDAVLGMKHYWREDQVEELPALDAALRPYVETSFSRMGEHYGVFALGKLAASEEFMNVSV
jgi:twitching motility protein PilI